MAKNEAGFVNVIGTQANLDQLGRSGCVGGGGQCGGEEEEGAGNGRVDGGGGLGASGRWGGGKQTVAPLGHGLLQAASSCAFPALVSAPPAEC